jgi:hypothetical protein
VLTWRDLVNKLRSAMFFGLYTPKLPPVPSGVSRRQFLKLAGIAATVIAVMPELFVSTLDEPIDLDEPAHGISLSDLDAILKAVYLPAIVAMLNEDNHILKFMDRGYERGSFVVPVKVGRNYFTSCPASWKGSR